MKKSIIFSLFLFVTSISYSAIIIGQDYQGNDLIPSNGDVLQGTFTNVGHFEILSGLSVFVFPQTKLIIYATTITISGKLDAVGRGYSGGIGGNKNSPGENGFGGGLNGTGYGGGGASISNIGHGGGGGGHGDADGITPSGGKGMGTSGGAGGMEYNSTDTLTIPLSPDDIFLGSGGGGGGGGQDFSGGTGGAGGGGIYLEARYIIVEGTITADGLTGGPGLNPDNCTGNPGGGGGGSGGGIMLKALENLSLSNSRLSANGGNGGFAFCADGTPPMYSGGGGAGGRIKLIYNKVSFSSVIISTASGIGGESGFGGGYAENGSSGTISFGILPSSPSGFHFFEVFLTSASYKWDIKPANEWGAAILNLPELTTYQFRLYESTSAMPFENYFILSVSSDITQMTETGLTPNATIYRFLTAYTDYGDSMPSESISTITYAAQPLLIGFFSVSSDTLSVLWSSGSETTGFNPSYTEYEIVSSTTANFSFNVSTSFVIGLSSSPIGLSPNTTYYFRVRAKGLNNILTDFSGVLSTATLCIPPSNPIFKEVYVGSAIVTWNGNNNPPETQFNVQLSTDNFLTISSQSLTTSTTVQFDNLNPNMTYFFRVRAFNKNNVPTEYSVVISTVPGEFSNLEAPPKPQPPSPISRYSYDGTGTFVWYPVPNVYRWWLEIGTEPNGKDFFYNDLLNNKPFSADTLSYSTNTLISGKTYYARIRAESPAGVLSEFSEPSEGISVWIAQTEKSISKPYNWPNPFDPAEGNTNIGFYLKEPAKVTLKIFTLQGHKVYEENIFKNSTGNNVLFWSGRNESGKIVEPGGYIAVIEKHYSSGIEVQKCKIAVLY